MFVAGDLLWYPVEGDPATRTALDVLVAFGRPKGYRGSYKQWVEDGIAPQVVFEVLSPGNRPRETICKFQFHERFGVEEHYLYDPDHVALDGWRWLDGELREIPETDGWTSPRLGIRFDLSGPELVIYRPDGRPFLTYVELARQRDELAHQRDELAQDLDTQRQRAERLAERLRALGQEP